MFNKSIEYQPDLQVWSQDLDRKYISMDNRRKYEYKEQPKPYNIQTVKTEPGDVLLVHVSEDLDIENVNFILKEVQQAFPDNNVLIANDYILKGLTIIKPQIGKVNINTNIESKELEKWLQKNVEFNL